MASSSSSVAAGPFGLAEGAGAPGEPGAAGATTSTRPAGRRRKRLGDPSEGETENEAEDEPAGAAQPPRRRRSQRTVAAAAGSAAAVPRGANSTAQPEGEQGSPGAEAEGEEYDFPHVGDDQQAKVYLFTTHSDVAKPHLLAAVRAAYAAVFPVGHPNAAGPQHGTVAREFGRRRPRRPHTHLAGEFGKRHRWKAVREELARTHGLQVRLSGILGGKGPGPRRRKVSRPKSSPSRGPCPGRARSQCTSQCTPFV